MSKKIYVGNLPFSASDDQIRTLFSEYGTVETVNLITDRDSGRPRGFGFVETSSGADEAIQALHQSQMDGRSLNVTRRGPARTARRGAPPEAGVRPTSGRSPASQPI